MKRLTYDKDTRKILEDIASNTSYYWRYQDKKHGGVIPVGHISHERIFDGDAPEYIEEGASCYDNPYQLLQYIISDFVDENNTDVVIFCGEHRGYGLDEEDIVAVTSEDDIVYAIDLKDFYAFCKNADIYFFGDKNLKEYAEQCCNI